jgi:hypothetical protein
MIPSEIPARILECLKRLCRVLLSVGPGFFGGLAQAQDSGIDFESLPPDFPGWSATLSNAEGKGEYRTAEKWDTPFFFSLDGDKPHAGSTSLKCEVNGELPGTLSFGPAPLAGKGAVEVRFFVRSEGLGSEGTFAFDEHDDGGQRLAAHWSQVKIPLGDDWQEVIWKGQLKPGASALRIRFVFKSVPSGAKIWLDDISVKSVEN